MSGGGRGAAPGSGAQGSASAVAEGGGRKRARSEIAGDSEEPAGTRPVGWAEEVYAGDGSERAERKGVLLRSGTCESSYAQGGGAHLVTGTTFCQRGKA